MTITHPTATKIPHLLEIHGRQLSDDYFWMRERENPAVLAHLEAENRYTGEIMKPTTEFQEQLYQEFLARIQETDARPPYPDGDFLYYSRTEKGLQYSIYCRAPKSNPEAVETILDLNQEAVGQKFMDLGEFDVSDDGHWLAYALDNTGYRQFTLCFKNLRDGSVAPDRLERVTSVAWCPDNRTVCYTTEDPVDKRSNQLWRHVVGSADSQLIYEEEDELFGLSVDRSRQGHMLFLQSGSMTSNEVRYTRADNPEKWEIFWARQENHEYDVDHRDGTFYVRTNQNAINFKVLTAPESRPQDSRELIPHDPLVKVEGVALFEKFIVVALRRGGSEELEIRPDGGEPYLIPVPDALHTLFTGVNCEFQTDHLRYHYQSPITPPTVFQFDVTTRQSIVLKQDAVLGGFRREDYHCERIYVPARDGTPIPVSLVFRADLDRSQPQPLLLYGYGSYGVSVDPTFSSVRLSLLQRGAIHAIAHIRGGGEMGEPWRLAGRMETKMNTFHDFIDCAQHLCDHGYTHPQRLVISGGSAGGLLVGVVSNLRPDLFAAVVSKVPFVDVINTMLDDTLPLTAGEFIEWGNPAEPAAFERMLEYSPYDNLKAQAYPYTYVEVSYHDSQVPYWEGAKLVARLRELKTDDRPVILKANLAAGHGGPSGRYEALREAAFDYAFVLWRMGLWTP